MSKDVKRLFTQFRPEHYALDLVPDRDKMTFSGKIVIDGQKVGRPSQRLTFHQKGLKITGAWITRHDKTGHSEVAVDRINLQKSFDEVRLHVKEMLYPGQYTVELEFSGLITRPMNGIYPCYFEDKGVKKMLIATQFESHHAREAFPCIDEPEAKATFDMTLTTPAGETVLGNTPVAKQTTKGKLQTTTFETTPKMSTYLVAFVYGDMVYKEAKTKQGVAVRTYATPPNGDFLEFGLDVAIKCLDFYNDYFDLPFPLPKSDLIALPDFASGAMENWGCITFREACLIVDPANTSLPVKQYVAMVVAHELAHMWFGNLVTMRWWTDLWLNEGFASWIEYLAIDHLFPEWDMWTQYVADEQQVAMRLDALENTHPIEVPVHHPDEIRTIFDTISYNKGSSVIHMLQQYLGADTFRDGLRHYLKEHQYGNTDTIDLWNSLAKVSGQPVKEFMHAWTSQPGFPLLTLKTEGDKLVMSQQRFFSNPVVDHSKDKLLWPIPLKGPGDLAKFALEKSSGSVALPANKTLKVNVGQSGYYRVAYDKPQIKALATAVAAGKLEALDRLGVLSDSFEAAKAGHQDTVAALTLLQAYNDEDNQAVWDVMAGNLGSIRGVMDDEKLRELMNPAVRKLVAKQLKRLGWEPKKGEPYFDSLLRPTILGMASAADEQSVVKECQRRFEAMKQPTDLPTDLRGVIYTTAARHGDNKTFDKLLKLHNDSISSEEKTTLVAALTAFKQPALVKKALSLVTTDTVRLQDAAYWIAYSFGNRYGKVLAWEWLTAHWDWLEKNLGDDLSFPRFPLYAARSFSDAKFLPKYKAFFEPLLTPVINRTYKQGVETLQWQSAWKQRDLPSIKKFFTDLAKN